MAGGGGGGGAATAEARVPNDTVAAAVGGLGTQRHQAAAAGARLATDQHRIASWDERNRARKG